MHYFDIDKTLYVQSSLLAGSHGVIATMNLAALRNFVIVVAKHDDQDDESEDDHEEEGDNDSNHSVTGFFGIRFVG